MIPLRRVVLFATFLLGAAGLASAPVVQELGAELTYVRLATADDPVPAPTKPAVLDLRYFTPSADSSLEALASYLMQPGPIRVVVYDHTPPAALVKVLSRRAATVLTVAPGGATPPADFELAIEPEADRAAYDALVEGATVESLTHTTAPKPRLDEAALVRARSGSRPPVGEDVEAAPEAASARVPVDRLLQRAIQLARGVKALRPRRAD